MTDWNDPELKSLRDDFVASFEKRREALAVIVQTLKPLAVGEILADTGAGFDLRVVVHNLAGSAATYGFVEIGRFSGDLDDLLSMGKGISADRLVSFARELIRILEVGQKNACDVEADASVTREITSCAESLAAGAKP
jgi:hypothetical protein